MLSDPGAIPIFITEVEQFGGAERSLLALSRWLYGQGLANYLLTYIDHCNIAQFAGHPLPVVALNPGVGFRNKMGSLRRHFAERSETAPVPIVSGYQPALHATLAGLRGFHCLMHDTPGLFSDHKTRSLKAKLRIGLSNRIAGWGLRSGGVTVVTSEFLRADCRRDFGVDAKIARMGGVANDPAAGTHLPKRGFGGETLKLLSVSRVDSNKRIDWLLRGLSQLERSPVAPLDRPLSQVADWRFDVVGKGPLIPELSALAATLGIADRVHFHGFVSDDALRAIYADAHLFLMPAVQGYGIPAIEALQRQIPVLLHRESGVSDILLDTPWATVLEGGEDRLALALAKAIEGAVSARHAGVAPPELPTEESWARRVAQLCRWI
jgi:glycosyltransferase involved in cell wall biosynthesis